MTAETIYALSSGSGRAGVAVIRISGPQTRTALERLIGKVPPARHAVHAGIRGVEQGDLIDRGLVLFFPAPASFTGEDVAELQVHGSPAVVARVLADLSQMSGCKLADPGAFTERAFLNGKLDLTEVEGLGDLLAAETERQRQDAVAQSTGLLRRRTEAWRADLVRALALIEAVLDFSDEADVTEGPIAEANAIAVGLKGELDAALSDLARAETVRSGLTIVLSGPPNVGKSSLLNRLAARDVAIVTEKAGTTRDLLEVPLDLGGMKVTLVDSAGLRETDDPIEREGVLRARRAAETADLILRLTEGPITDGGYDTGGATPIWHIATKSDLYLDPDDPMHADGGHPRHRVSAKTGDGIDDLITDLVDWACEHAGSIELPLVTRRRQYDWIADAAAALTSFTAHPTEQLELKAEDLRRAATALARLTGLIDPEDVLDSLFAGFCIGK